MEEREAKTETVIVRMSKTEKQDFEQEAGKRHMKLSEFIRFLFTKFKG